MSWGQYHFNYLLYTQHIAYFNVSRLELGGIFLIFNKSNNQTFEG